MAAEIEEHSEVDDGRGCTMLEQTTPASRQKTRRPRWGYPYRTLETVSESERISAPFIR